MRDKALFIDLLIIALFKSDKNNWLTIRYKFFLGGFSLKLRGFSLELRRSFAEVERFFAELRSYFGKMWKTKILEGFIRLYQKNEVPLPCQNAL